MTSRERAPATTPGCPSGHALALARWEQNRKGWLTGDFFGLTAKNRRLQELVGGGGTLWIVVSRRWREGRRYSLSFRLSDCRSRTYRSESKFGRYAVHGNPDRSALFAENDARLLLLSLRFYPQRAIDHDGQLREDRLAVIGPSLQTARCLSETDVRLLERFVAATDRWSVFLSYRRRSSEQKATRISSELRRLGVSVFRDVAALKAGRLWQPTIESAIARARCLVALIDPSTVESKWVRWEIQCARSHGVQIIPVLVGGDFSQWPDLASLHALTYGQPDYRSFISELRAAIGDPRW